MEGKGFRVWNLWSQAAHQKDFLTGVHGGSLPGPRLPGFLEAPPFLAQHPR